MPKMCIQTNRAPKAIGPYSQAVRTGAGEMLFISGQLGINPATGELVSGGITKETEQAFLNIKEIVLASGGDLSCIVKTTVLLANMADFKQVNDIYSRFFPIDPPARAAYQVAALPLDGRIEIEAIAII